MRAKSATLILSLLVSLALLGLPALPAAEVVAGPKKSTGGGIEPQAGAWTTWVLASGGQLRLPAPPDKKATRAEIDQLKALAAGRDAAALATIRFWDAGAPGYRWNELALRFGPSDNRFRGLALLNVAIHDATVAAWETKYAYNRPRPSDFDPSLATALPTPASPAYPSEHAVTAGAAAAVLAYLVPNLAATFEAAAEEAARSRLLAGTDYPSDVAAGLALGRQVGALVIERARADGSDVRWAGSVPTGPGKWTGTNPSNPQAAHWKTWALTSGSQFRPGPPPAFDSERMAAELAAVKGVARTVDTNSAVYRWAPNSGTLWPPIAHRLIFENRLDANPPRAARVYALAAIAAYDGYVAVWDAKYEYWAIRPHQLDPTLTTVIPVPAHPSYPSGHAAIVGAAIYTLAGLFPADREALEAQAQEMANSRIWAGIHYPIDCEVGLAMARSVAQAVLARAAADE
jgi:membrane-associated phospholipid phosphatase